MAVTSASHGIEIGRRALQAHQTALQVTSHNIANANTPGFSRRRIDLETADAGTAGGVGSGVDAVAVVRLRSRFLDSQMRVEQQLLGRWEAIEESLTGIEGIFNEPAGAGSSEAGTIFNEPSGLGLSGSLSRFWNTWQDLANVPEGGAARASVRQEADFLTTTLHQLNQQLIENRLGLDEEIVRVAGDINEIVDQLAALNGEIPRSEFDGGTSGDLLDKRDQLLEELASKVDISVAEAENGQVTVLLSGHNLVQATNAIHLGVRQITVNDFPTSTLVFEDDGSIAPIREGRLRGLIEVRDQTIPDLLTRLDQIANQLVESINGLHRVGFGATGQTGINFFDPSKLSASNIELDDLIKEQTGDLNNIAASGDGNSGDNGTAIGIAGLRNQKSLSGGTDTIEEFYNTLLGVVGSKSKEAQTMAENHRLFSSQIENRRQGVQGVSLNDEAAQLILFQRAYQAAARTVGIIDELMEVTINL